MSFPLHDAARDGKELIVKGLLSESPKEALKKDQDGRIPLHWAVSFQHKEIVSLLLHPWTLAKEHLEPFEIDIDDYTDDSGWTALHIASSVGNLEILELLLKNDPKPDVNLPTATGLRCVHLAVSKKHLDVVRRLVEEGASLKLKDSKGQFPLHRAASVGSVALVEYLAEKGGNVNVQDGEGWTALHHALAEGFGDIAVLLVKKFDANTTIEDSDGKKPIDVAVDRTVKAFFLKETEQ